MMDALKLVCIMHMILKCGLLGRHECLEDCILMLFLDAAYLDVVDALLLACILGNCKVSSNAAYLDIKDAFV